MFPKKTIDVALQANEAKAEPTQQVFANNLIGFKELSKWPKEQK